MARLWHTIDLVRPADSVLRELMVDLTKAENWCARRGEKFTPTRRAVFELLADQEQALTAYQLLERLQAAMPHAKPPTIYRALEFLQRMGMVHRIDSQNAFVVCDDFPHRHDAAFLVCLECGNVSEVAVDKAIHDLKGAAQDAGFAYRYATIEMRGLCRLCRPSH